MRPSVSPRGFCVSVARRDQHRHLQNSPRFPNLARLPETVREACWYFFFAPRSSASRDYLCLSSCTLAYFSVQCGSAHFGPAQLSLSPAMRTAAPPRFVWTGGGGGRCFGEVDSFQLESQGSHHAGEPCPWSVPFSTWTIPPVTGAGPRRLPRFSLLDYRGAYSVIIPASAPAAP